MSDRSENAEGVAGDGGRDDSAAGFNAATIRSLAAPSGGPFFARFLPGVLEALGADQIVVGEYGGPNRGIVRAVGVYGEGRLAENLEYDVAGMPCEVVAGGQIVLIPSEVRQRFPTGGLLAEFELEGYAGAPLIGSTGATLGVLCGLYADPIADPARVKQLIPLFAARAAAELERRELDLSLRKALARLATALDVLPFDAWICDEDGRYVIQNASSRKHWGVQLGRRPDEIEELPAQVLREWLENNSRVQEGETVRAEVTYRHGDDDRHVQKILTRVHDDAGSYGVFGVNIDVTGMRASERGRALADARLARLFDLTAAGGGVLTSTLRWSVLSAALCRLLRTKPENLLGKAAVDALHRDDHADAAARFAALRDGESDRFTAVWRAVRRDGTVLPLRFDVSAVRDPSGAFDSCVLLVAEEPAAGQSSSA